VLVGAAAVQEHEQAGWIACGGASGGDEGLRAHARSLAVVGHPWAVELIEDTVEVAGRRLELRRPPDPEALITEQAFEHEEFLPYWAELWPSGVALARRVAARSLKGARVLELGCGLGLPSLAAALAGGRVLATDWSPQAIDLLRDNAERNDAELELAIVDWAHPAEIVERAPWDLVLGADLLYERRNVEPLLRLVPELLGASDGGDEAPGRGSGELWLADPGRAPAADFLAGFERLAEDADGPVTVYRLRPA
jgi:predicted nicotinamide N-methyase